MTDWNTLISEVVAGNWKDPTTGKAASVPFEVIRIEEDLDGGEADMIAPLKLGKRIAVVSDVNTNEAMGRRAALAVRRHINDAGELTQVSFGTPVFNTLQEYKDIPLTSMPFGQSMALLALVEFNYRFL